MSDSHPPDADDDAARLAELDRRLRQHQAAKGAREGQGRHAGMGALGVALRMSVELVAAFFVGGLMGLGLDRLLGTEPWLMLVGLAFGFAAGVRQAVRAAVEMNAQASKGADDEST